MIDKIKKIFNNKEKRVENLASLLIILIITIIAINKIFEEEPKKDYENKVGVELASNNLEDDFEKENLEKRLENILSKINGVGKVSVLVTYSESKSIIPVYDISLNQSKTEENDSGGNKKVSETTSEEKKVLTDSSSNMITEKIIMPQIEGAIIIAQGASNSSVKGDIISAVEAVTGIATHKIKVYEMGEN